MEEKEIKIDTDEQEKYEKSKFSNRFIKTEFLTPNQNRELLKKNTETKHLPKIKESVNKMEEKQKQINTIEEDVIAVKNDLKTILKILENPPKQPVCNLFFLNKISKSIFSITNAETIYKTPMIS
jgi:vancomycin resistance protein YoaR